MMESCSWQDLQKNLQDPCKIIVRAVTVFSSQAAEKSSGEASPERSLLQGAPGLQSFGFPMELRTVATLCVHMQVNGVN